MPTNQNAYNSRVTSEALEKKFRDTFTSQGGAELVDDLYASGVVVPVVDFTAAAQGTELGQNLQTAWDFSTGFSNSTSGTSVIINNPGFWSINLVVTGASVVNAASGRFSMYLWDGATKKTFWQRQSLNIATSAHYDTVYAGPFVVFVDSGKDIRAEHSVANYYNASIWYRQIADINGNLTNPLGFTSS